MELLKKYACLKLLCIIKIASFQTYIEQSNRDKEELNEKIK